MSFTDSSPPFSKLGQASISHGLHHLKTNTSLHQQFKGNIGYLCNSASVDLDLRHGVLVMKAIFGEKLKKLFAPQHGLAAEDQDNMIESPHFFHSYFQLPVYSLYAETRMPTDEMLEDLDYLFIDIQDVGVRVYTFIYTMILTMEACAKKGVEVVILDRPNPLGGVRIEGNMLDMNFRSFIGLHPLPMRHGMTTGEIALMAKRFWRIDCSLQVVKMKGWEREMTFDQTGLSWILPSPNFPSLDTAKIYPGTVIFEGTNISEGRGTVKSFEMIGHPMIKPYELAEKLTKVYADADLEGFALRPLSFIPTFDKYEGKSCHGFQIHITDAKVFQAWKFGQLMCRELYKYMEERFVWKSPPFEYEYKKMPIDILNGTDRLRLWGEKYGSLEELEAIEKEGRDAFLEQRSAILLY